MSLFSGLDRMEVRQEVIPLDVRLGRHVAHDSKSRMFVIPTVRGVIPTTDIRHRRYGPKLDQGQLGSCTGYAAAHSLNCHPFRKGFIEKPYFTGANAVSFYSKATELDNISGKYPPDDTGSSGLYVCKAMQALNVIKGYQWAFGFKHGLEAIINFPLMQGSYWFEQMMYPLKNGQVLVKGPTYGGHEYLWIGVEIRSKQFPSQNRSWFLNSWGKSYGVNGYFWMTWKDHEKLLAKQGDLIYPVV